MGRQKANIHYIYKTTCIVTKRYYIGMHSTINLEDGYLGSGKRLRYSIRKYGKENHIKEILEFCESRDLLVEREKEVVNLELIQDKNCMNLKEGGSGGFSSEKHKAKFHSSGGKACYEKFKTDENFRKEQVERGRKSLENYRLLGTHKFDTFKNKKHSEETKKLMSERAKKRVGDKNSQYGTCWITNGVENKKIEKINTIPHGWYKGRK